MIRGRLSQSHKAFKIVELFVVVGVVTVLVLLFASWSRASMARSVRLCCVNSVKQCQLAFAIWAGDDHEGRFPMEVSDAMGGARESVTKGDVFRAFQVMSNELSTTIVIACPADTRYFKTFATNFTDLNNQNISYFVGLDANTNNAHGWLCGDRNITNGFASKHGVLTLQNGQTLSWTTEMHNQCGNVALADGSVQQMSNRGLRRLMNTNAAWSNRIALPE